MLQSVRFNFFAAIVNRFPHAAKAQQKWMWGNPRNGAKGLPLPVRLVIVLLLLIGQATAAPQTSQQKSEASKANPRCPAKDFGRFLELFSDNPNLQRRFTRFPLEYGEVIDPGYPEPSREYVQR